MRRDKLLGRRVAFEKLIDREADKFILADARFGNRAIKRLTQRFEADLQWCFLFHLCYAVHG